MKKNLQQWLLYLESLHPVEIEMGLERSQEVLLRLTLDWRKSRRITVAGTNGKGTCIAVMEALALQEGANVAAYTSPHLYHFSERIRVAGKPVDEEVLCQAFDAVETARQHTPLTYFEFTTLAAFVVFCQFDCDLWLLEVGMGGRLDTVNLLAPNVAVITSIDLDHEKWLGSNRESIGFEKAGILREGISLVCGEPDCPQSLRDRVANLSVKLVDITAQESEFKQLYQSSNRQLHENSVACGVAALKELGIDLSPQQAVPIISGLKIPGRRQVFTKGNHQWILDVGHNPAATTSLVDWLTLEKSEPKAIVFGVMADKNWRQIISVLLPMNADWIVFNPSLDTKRGQEPEDIHQFLVAKGARSCFKQNASDAVQAALTQTPKSASILVAGSFYTVAAVASELGHEKV